MNSKFSNKIIFLKEIERFKTIKRTCKKTSFEHESDADHSWHLAMLILTFESDFPSTINKNKLLKLALTHDLIELKTGDFNPFVDNMQQKKELERKSLIELKEELRENQQIYLLIEEYELQKTPESKIIKKLDKLMPLIQNITTKENNNYSAFVETKITKSQAKTYQEKFFKEDDFIRKIYLELFEEACIKKIFYEK